MPSPEPNQVILLSRQDMPAAGIAPVGVGTVAVFTTRSPRKETENEDSVAIIHIDEHRGLLAVADGLGGHADGAKASELALATLAECVLEPAHEEEQLRGAILRAFELANERILDLGVGAATTLAVVECEDRSIRTYHAGDSMILAVGQRGRIRRQTISHSPVGYAVESGLLDETEAIHHEDRHIVSNMLGSTDMRIEIGSPLSLAAFDSLVLASDGLFDNLHVEEVVELVRRGPLPKAAEHVRQAALARMVEPQEGHPSKPDDLTFIVYRPRSSK